MEVLICQSCGTVLRGKSKNCAGCGLIVSTHSPTTAPTLTNTNQALSVAVRPDPIILEKVLAKRAAGIDVYSKNYSIGGAYNGGNSSYGANSSSEQTAAKTESFFAAAPPTQTEQGAPVGSTQSYAPSAYAPTEFQPTPEPATAQNNIFVAAPQVGNGNGNGNGHGNGNGNGGQPEYAPQPEPASPAENSQSAQSTSSNFVAAPQSAFMSNQTFDEPQAAESTTSSAKPDFFTKAPSNMQPAASTSQTQLPAAGQQYQSGSQPAMGNSRAQQSLSGAQPPPMTSNVGRPIQSEPSMPPSAPQPAPAPPATPEAKAAPAAKAPEPATEDDDEVIEEPRSASQMDFFAASSASASAKKDENAPRAQKSTSRAEAAASDEPDTRKFTRSKNKDKAERSVEAKSEDDDDKGFEQKSKKASAEDGDDDAPKKSKNSLEVVRKKRSVDEDEDDDDDDTRKFVKKSAKSKKAAKDEDDDDDDDDFSPPRRSFSGSGPSKSIKPTTKRGRRVVDEDHDDEDDDDDDGEENDNDNKGRRRSINRFEHGDSHDQDDEEEDESSPPYVRFLKKPVRFLGFSMPRHMQLVVIGVFLVIVPMLFGFTAAVLNWSGEQIKGLAPQEKMPLLTGDWKMQVTDNGKPFSCELELQQIGDNFYAQGKDFSPFYMIGHITKPDHLQFNKLYRLPDGSFDKPIEYAGDFDLTQGTPFARGFWRLEKRQGAFYKAHTVVLQGEWQMKQTRVRSHVNVPLPAGVNPGAPQQGGGQMGGGNQGGGGGPKKPFWQSCFEVAGFLLVASIGLVVLVWKSFGTNGTLSIMGKRQYIPSQYKGDHNKILNVLSKPARPGSMPIGVRNEWKPFFPWEKKDLCLPPEIRRKDPHMLLLGAGDKGKSRMIASLITADIEANDRAVVLIDSDGALVDLITRWISIHPKGRQFAKRVIVLDPTYKHGSLAYNPLEMPEDGDLQSAASSLVYGFKAIYTEPPGSQSQWNQQTANILRNAALLLMANGKTLIDLPTLLQDNDFRDILLENIERKKKEKTEYITLIETWGQYKKLARTDQWINWVEPILNRVGPMLSDPRIRPILTKPEGDIKLTQVIREKSILLVKIKKGQLDQNANLLGSLIVTGLKQAAMSISGEKNQKPVALYLDEFDNFIEKETFESITSETDKFQIGLVGALRTLQHLPEDFRNNLIINVGTMACFALSKKDGDLLGPQMFRVDGRKIKHQTMSNFFNPVNTSPQFELISDEEKLNIDRVVGQDARNFYAYRVGSQAGVFHMKTHDFNDIADREVNHKLIDKMYGVAKKAANNDD